MGAVVTSQCFVSAAPSWSLCLCPTAGPPHRQQLWPGGCSCESTHGLRLLQAPSFATLQSPPWLHEEICSVWCPWATGAQSAPLWASPGLHGAAAQCLEHLLPSLVPAGLLLSVSYSPLPAAVAQFFPSLTLLSQSTPGVAHGSVVVAAGPCWSSWSWLWSDTGQCWALHTPEIAV